MAKKENVSEEKKTVTAFIFNGLKHIKKECEVIFEHNENNFNLKDSNDNEFLNVIRKENLGAKFIHCSYFI